MKKVTQIVVAVLAATLLITGCGGVDKNKLAQLTGTKNFEQIKQAYIYTVLQNVPEDKRIYAYWLQKHEEENSGFDYNLFAKNIDMEYEKTVSEIENKMKTIEIEIDKISLHQLQDERRTASFLALDVKIVKETYLPFLNRMIEQKLAFSKK